MSSINKPAEKILQMYTPAAVRVIKAFERFMNERLGSRKRAARFLHCDPTTIGRLLKHSYAGDVPGYVERMRQVLRRERLRRTIPDEPALAAISTTAAVHRTMQIAHLEGRIAAVLGPTGVGKTVAVRQYGETTDNVASIVAGCTGTKEVVAKRLCAALDMETRGRTAKLRDALIERLRGTDWLLVVDEIDEVPTSTLRLLREITDETRVGLVIVGTETFLEDLRAKGSKVVNQFLGRVAYVEVLAGLGRDDVEAIAEPYKLDKAAMEVLTAAASGQARRVAALLVAAQRMNGKGLTVKSLRKARTQLMPVLRG